MFVSTFWCRVGDSSQTHQMFITWHCYKYTHTHICIFEILFIVEIYRVGCFNCVFIVLHSYLHINNCMPLHAYFNCLSAIPYILCDRWCHCTIQQQNNNSVQYFISYFMVVAATVAYFRCATVPSVSNNALKQRCQIPNESSSRAIVNKKHRVRH